MNHCSGKKKSFEIGSKELITWENGAKKSSDSNSKTRESPWEDRRERNQNFEKSAPRTDRVQKEAFRKREKGNDVDIYRVREGSYGERPEEGRRLIVKRRISGIGTQKKKRHKREIEKESTPNRRKETKACRR